MVGEIVGGLWLLGWLWRNKGAGEKMETKREKEWVGRYFGSSEKKKKNKNILKNRIVK
jgi:hypothetical protein